MKLSKATFIKSLCSCSSNINSEKSSSSYPEQITNFFIHVSKSFWSVSWWIGAAFKIL